MPKHHQRRRVRLPLALSLALTATIFAAVPPRAPQRPAPLGAAREEVEKEGPDLIRARIEYYRRRHENDPARRLQLARGELTRRAGRDAKRAAGLLSAAPQWRPLGPSDGSGRMTAIAPHPTVPGTLYVGAD